MEWVKALSGEVSFGNGSVHRRTVLSGSCLLFGGIVAGGRVHADSIEFLEPDRFEDSFPRMDARLIEHDQPLGFVHCASICEWGDELVAVWYAGSREGAGDVRLWSSRSRNGGGSCDWTIPKPVLDRSFCESSSGQYVRKVGNPLLIRDAGKRLWLLFVSIAMGGWSTSSLNASVSIDGGDTWAPSQRLWLSPLWNVSELVRCPPVYLTSGEVAVPIYHECAGVFPEVLFLNLSGSKPVYRKSRMAGGRSWLQPSVVPTGKRTANCYLRCTGKQKKVGFQTTEDVGVTWSEPRVLDLPNPNSGICAVQMLDGGILMALNNSEESRDSLSLVYSADGVSGWQEVAVLDRDSGEKFSYPSMIRGRGGKIHLIYSWKMRAIKHVCFNDAWVLQQLGSKLPQSDAGEGGTHA